MLTALVSVLYYIVAFVWTMFYFLIMLFSYIVTFWFDREKKILHVLSKWWGMSVFRMNPLWQLKVTGGENIDTKKSYVVTVNHQSMVDIPLIYALPRLNFKWVAKKEVYKWPLFGVLILLHDDITVDAKGGSLKMTKEFIIAGSKRLKNGTSVAIFPEGTRSKNGDVGNFKEGAFMLAKQAKVDVLPCVIDGGKTMMKGWKVQRNIFHVKITPSISAETVADSSTRELMEMVRKRTIEGLAEIRNKA